MESEGHKEVKSGVAGSKARAGDQLWIGPGAQVLSEHKHTVARTWSFSVWMILGASYGRFFGMTTSPGA